MKGKSLRKSILKIIENEWPISITQISLKLGIHKTGGHERKRKAAVAKIVYHVDKLKKENKIRNKKIGGAQILWPTNIEKLRMINELLEGI